MLVSIDQYFNYPDYRITLDQQFIVVTVKMLDSNIAFESIARPDIDLTSLKPS